MDNPDYQRTVIRFVARVLRHGTKRSHKPTGDPLPLGAWDRYHAEDFDEMSELLGAGIVHALCKGAGGWRKMPVLVGEECWSSRPAEARLWETGAEGGELCFTDASLRLCEGLYNLALKPAAVDPEITEARERAAAELMRLDFASTGDALTLYWMVVGLWRELDPSIRIGPDRPNIERVIASVVPTHPLLALRHGPVIGLTKIDDKAIEALLGGPHRPMLSWLLDHALSEWRRLESQLWDQPIPFHVRARRTQASLVDTWLRAIQRSGWYHLATPFADLQRWTLAAISDLSTLPEEQLPGPGEHLEIGEIALRRVNGGYWNQSQQQRHTLRQSWAALLESLANLDRLHASVARVHPADREPNHVWLTNWWAKTDMSRCTEDARDVAKQVEGRLG